MRGWLVAVVALATMAVMTGCGNAAAAQVATGTPRPTATPTPTPVDDVTAIRTLVRRFMDDFAKSAETGDLHAVETYAVPGSQASAVVVDNGEISRDQRNNFMASRVEIDERSWTVSVTGTQATTAFSFRAFGHDAHWPDLKSMNADYWGPSQNYVIHLIKRDDQWLFSTIDF